MGTKAVVGSLGLLALGTLASGSFLNVNILKNPFAGMSSLFSKSDSKGTDKKGNTEEKKLEEIAIEKAGQHIALSEKAPEVVEQTFVSTVTEPAQEEATPLVVAEPTVEVQPPKPLEVQSQRETAMQQRVSTSSPTVARPVEEAKYYGGGSGYSQRRGSNSNGDGVTCVTSSNVWTAPTVVACNFGWR